jgi:hypothetical protein
MACKSLPKQELQFLCPEKAWADVDFQPPGAGEHEVRAKKSESHPRWDRSGYFGGISVIWC